MKKTILSVLFSLCLMGFLSSHAQIILINSFNPVNASGLCGIAYDPEAGYIWVYQCSDNEIQCYTTAGTFVSSVPMAGETANDVDLEIAPETLNIGETEVLPGQLLVVNGESGAAEIYAVDNISGDVIDTLNCGFGNSHVVGGSYHDQRNSFYLIQDNVPGATLENMIAEINPVTGDTLQTIQITGIFNVSYGDIEVASSGNLFIVSSIEDSIAEFSPAGILVKKHGLPDGVGSLSGIALHCEASEAWVCNTSGTIFHLGQFPCDAPIGIPSDESSAETVSSFAPNPFKNSGTFTITMPGKDHLKVKLMNAAGHEIRILFDGEANAETKSFSLSGENLTAGVYFIISEINGHSVIRKIVKLE